MSACAGTTCIAALRLPQPITYNPAIAIKLLLDTDIGSDIDDAVCLAYLLAKPDCELLGITTVSGEPERRAMIASTLCKVAAKDTPIYPGVAEPLLVESRQPQAPQADVLARWPHETRFPRGEAIQFLRQTIRRYPGEVILLTIGPLTNIALLFKADPEVPSLLKGMVSMGGLFNPAHTRNWRGGKWEWNIYCDPHSAAIVYRTPVTVHRSIGLDVTTQVTMDAAEVRRRFQAPLLQPVLDFAEVWFRSVEKITFHDPLAATTIFDAHICQFEHGEVRVEVHDPDAFAITRWAPNTRGRHEVAVSVDGERFFAEYFGAFAGHHR